ncbi:hypothetical protein B4Q13_25120 [Lacticaseibacillus rhamnosus]
MNAAVALHAVLRPIYLSLTLQMTTVVLCLAYSGRLVWLRTYTLAFVCVVLLSIAISAVLPAAGAFDLALFRRRELLRIVLRDGLRIGTLAEITEEISNLADAILGRALESVMSGLKARYGAPESEDAPPRRAQQIPVTPPHRGYAIVREVHSGIRYAAHAIA